MQHVTPVHVSSRIHTAESGKAGNVRAWSHSKNKSVMSEKRESGKEGNDRAWSHSINKSRENLVRQAMLELGHIL